MIPKPIVDKPVPKGMIRIEPSGRPIWASPFRLSAETAAEYRARILVVPAIARANREHYYGDVVAERAWLAKWIVRGTVDQIAELGLIDAFDIDVVRALAATVKVVSGGTAGLHNARGDDLPELLATAYRIVNRSSQRI